MKRQNSYDGLQGNIRNLRLPKIEVWKNQYPDRDYIIDIEFPEFNSICPKTGLPDFAVIKISYTPDKYCIEFKSFKLYLVKYRDVPIFNEHAVNRILDDFALAAKPRFAQVIGEFNARGGMKTIVTAQFKQ